MTNTDYSKYNFDDIRPYSDEEVKDAIESLVDSEGMKNAMRYIKPEMKWEQYVEVMRMCKTKKQFKEDRKSVV